MIDPLVLRNALLIDGTRTAPRPDATVGVKAENPIDHIGLFEDGDVGPEVGYWIGRPFWGRGYATEALEAGLVWASRKWKRRALVAGHFSDNPASGRVLEKAGFLYTGEVRTGFSRARGADAQTRRMVWLA